MIRVIRTDGNLRQSLVYNNNSVSISNLANCFIKLRRECNFY